MEIQVVPDLSVSETDLISAAVVHYVEFHLEEVLLVGQEFGEDQSGFALGADGDLPVVGKHDTRRPLVRIRMTPAEQGCAQGWH